MAQRKGQTGNPNGRPAGSPNKTTAEIRNAFQLLVSNNIDTMQADLVMLEPEKRLSFIIKLAEFFIPKLQSMSIENQIELEYKQLEALLLKTPESAIDLITDKVINLYISKNSNENGNN